MDIHAFRRSCAWAANGLGSYHRGSRFTMLCRCMPSIMRVCGVTGNAGFASIMAVGSCAAGRGLRFAGRDRLGRVGTTCVAAATARRAWSRTSQMPPCPYGLGRRKPDSWQCRTVSRPRRAWRWYRSAPCTGDAGLSEPCRHSVDTWTAFDTGGRPLSC